MEEEIRNPEDVRNEIEEQMNEAIKLTMATMGLELDDQEAINMVKTALRNKLKEIIGTVAFHSNGDQNSANVLKLKYLKLALAERDIKVDRPDYIVEQQQSQSKAMNTRNRKSSNK
ncbi:hypothetical protein TVAG_198830 [Trichomonas vaginalis G3]|uniref:Uncharacterized protein n=1 Tax=Trichomonas vaginalis (strain ATCC PRA-98 / G3) TaxID=412133 RepID=A2DDR8_TRIV3|nr:hypothetical protein TVAGG3_0999270 [Trichomonas vaginalis G3]EAY21444.1 hypothetical protein TVAG_198830 [Trichomonas vaginalis G3]KAI5490657.1 hypothetical protein TVAGG3_0999270 [Trichomonas vaginalis G3]|eukprot:XP_001582430.1 hypothetical protein [Trichomonas vaginalis G3]